MVDGRVGGLRCWWTGGYEGCAAGGRAGRRAVLQLLKSQLCRAL